MNSIKFSTDQGRSIAYPQPRMPSIHSKLQIGVKLTGNIAGVMLNTAMMRYPFAAAFLLAAVRFVGAGDYLAPAESDYAIRDFKFMSGETLPELRIHYRTLGKADKDSQGKTTNALLVMHGTTGSGAQFIRPEFAGEISALRLPRYGRRAISIID